MVTGLVRAMATAVLTVVMCLVTTLAINSATASQPETSVASFVALAKHALAGTFTETYRLTGPGPSSGTSELFQQAPSGAFPFPTGHAKWSFLFQSQTGISSQWIEEGSTAWDCWRASTTTTWTCSGPGRFEESNGFFLSIEPYIPGDVIGDINELELGLKEKAPQIKNLTISDSISSRFGPLRCLAVDGIVSCFDRSGVLVSQRGGPYWSSITLIRRSSSVPRRAFNLVGMSTSSGEHFTVVPS